MKKQIKNFIVETLMLGEGSIEDDQDLFASGAIDSLGFIKLLTFIEKNFNVHMDMTEVTMDKFGSVNDIEKTIKEKMS